MAFSIGVYEHPQFELLHLLSEFYKGYSLTLSIDFLILNIWLFIEASILKTYYSQYYTPPNHHRVVYWSEHISLLVTMSYSPRSLRGRQCVPFLINIEHISLLVTMLYSPRSSRGRQCVSFLINIEFWSLRFYVSFLYRGILTILISLISCNSC
jgi:hypothetical protein